VDDEATASSAARSRFSSGGFDTVKRNCDVSAGSLRRCVRVGEDKNPHPHSTRVGLMTQRLYDHYAATSTRAMNLAYPWEADQRPRPPAAAPAGFEHRQEPGQVCPDAAPHDPARPVVAATAAASVSAVSIARHRAVCVGLS
jgi:hypothetical protein